MRITLPNLSQLPRTIWTREFHAILAEMPEAEVGDVPQQKLLSPRVRELFHHEEDELLALIGVTRVEWAELTAKHTNASAKALFWELELKAVRKSSKRGTAIKCPTQIGRLQQHQYVLQFVVDGKRVAINTKEYSGFNHHGSHEFDLILDCQYDPARGWRENVVPFTMFAHNMAAFHQHIEQYREIVRSQKKQYRVGWAGCSWRSRKRFLTELDGYPNIFIRHNWVAKEEKRIGHGARKNRTNIAPSYEDYLKDAGSWDWALVMFGRGSNRKGNNNQREHEFAALQVPMVLNYQPTYYEPLIAGEHYLFAKSPDDVKRLADSNREGNQMAENAYQYWKRNMSAEGIQNLVRRICQERL